LFCKAVPEEPEQRLDRPREDVEMVVAQLAQLGPAHRDRPVAETSGADRQRANGQVKQAGWCAFGWRGHP
jgi:hypothetical protein